MKMTKSDYIRKKNARHIYFGSVSKGIKSGGIALHLENGQILIDEEEADAYFAKQIEARLTAQRPDLFSSKTAA
jgi:hypothetical protein